MTIQTITIWAIMIYGHNYLTGLSFGSVNEGDHWRYKHTGHNYMGHHYMGHDYL